MSSTPDGTDRIGRIVLTVEEAEADQRLDVFLARRLDVSRSEVRRLLALRAVRLGALGALGDADGRTLGPRDKGVPLRAAERLEVCGFRPPGERRPPAEPEAPLRVLAEGPGWVGIDKRPGQAVHPLREDEPGSVLGALAARHPEIHGVGEGGLRSGVVHRLDTDTSGALLFATEQATWQRLRDAFRAHRVRKRYVAIALGEIREPATCRVGLRVAQHRPARVRVTDAGEAERRADVRVGVLALKPLEALRGATLVEIDLQTGFLHQIRATLAYLGHPVAGDRTYGGEAAQDPSGAPRQMLHALQIELEEIHVESPLPEDLIRCRKALGGGEG